MTDAAFMSRALALSGAMAGRTGVNPAVGCVIVKDGAVIAEAATAEGGRPHAEEQAIAQVGVDGATAYVTLEPCNARSTRKPSCTDLLISHRIARVVIAARDPHPLANGAGIARMRDAGIVVEVGLMEAEARMQNVPFFAQWDRA